MRSNKQAYLVLRADEPQTQYAVHTTNEYETAQFFAKDWMRGLRGAGTIYVRYSRIKNLLKHYSDLYDHCVKMRARIMELSPDEVWDHPALPPYKVNK